MTTTKKLLVLLALAAGCRADNRSSISILGRAAPSSATTCTYAPGGQYDARPVGVLDLAYAGYQTYELPLYVNNELGDPTAGSETALSSSKNWLPQAARVRINPSSYVKDYHPNPPLIDFRAENVVPANGNTIPVNGDGLVIFEAISHELGLALASVAPPGGDKRRIVIGVTLQGRTNDGLQLDTGEWYYPIDLCVGCLACINCTPSAIPLCAPTDTLLSGCGGPGQDLETVCEPPATP